NPAAATGIPTWYGHVLSFVTDLPARCLKSWCRTADFIVKVPFPNSRGGLVRASVSKAWQHKKLSTAAAGSSATSLRHSKTEGLRPNPDKSGDYGNDPNLMHRSDNFLYFATELSFLAFAF